jgi:hypothetical protein
MRLFEEIRRNVTGYGKFEKRLVEKKSTFRAFDPRITSRCKIRVDGNKKVSQIEVKNDNFQEGSF